MKVPSHRRTAATLRRAVAALACFAALGAMAEPSGVDPLAIAVELDDAERFAELFRTSAGAPTAEALQAHYLDPAGRGVEIFTPWRIRDAQNLAQAIALDPAPYRDAIERCLPLVRQTEPDLRAIYLGFRGLLPEQPLPRISVVFGAGNSGGTADRDLQVLGLEVLCRLAPDDAAFRRLMRHFYAHETVHTFQRIDAARFANDPLLASALAEGTADYLARLVTGEMPDPERARWAEAHAAFVLAEFARDIAAARSQALTEVQRNAVMRRWVGNAGSPPEGWPSELGYWVGMTIAEGYVANAPDRAAAIRELLRLDDPRAVLAGSGITLPSS
jgi:hypothetical protein